MANFFEVVRDFMIYMIIIGFFAIVLIFIALVIKIMVQEFKE